MDRSRRAFTISNHGGFIDPAELVEHGAKNIAFGLDPRERGEGDLGLEVQVEEQGLALVIWREGEEEGGDRRRILGSRG